MNFKKIPPNYYLTIIDRLTRFEPACVRYSRVFQDIINKFALSVSKKELSLKEQIQIASQLLNNDTEPNEFDLYIQKYLIELEQKYFKFDETSYQYLSCRINYSSIIKNISNLKEIPKNVLWLKSIIENKNFSNELRFENSLLYPIEKIILTEGETERILLNTLVSMFDVDFDKLGYLLISAGGKNRVARKYYEMSEYVNLPFFILLDNDAYAIKELIDVKLRAQDKIYILKSGEFEDLIPKKVVIETLNYIHNNEYKANLSDINSGLKMSENIAEICKKYGFGEYKKANFARMLKEFIKTKDFKSDFINSEIAHVAELLAD